MNNDSIDMLLKLNPNVRCAFRMNLSQNLVTEKHAVYGYSKKLKDADTYDAFNEALVSLMADESMGGKDAEGDVKGEHY